MSGEESKLYACTACAQRKVKCDKHQPCLACVRSRLQCIYRATPPPQRRKRKVENHDQTLLERLRSHEATLRSAGLPFQTFDDLNDRTGNHDEGSGDAAENGRGPSLPAGQVEPLPARPTESPSIPTQTLRRRAGILVPEHGGIRYYESGMIGFLGQEYRQAPIHSASRHGLGENTAAGTRGLHQEACEALASSLLTGLPSSHIGTQYQHPPAAAVMKYWSIFLDNVHPLTKVIHAPTMLKVMADSTSNAPKTSDALRYSIYSCAVASLTDRECREIFGASQPSLLSELQSATRNSLLESSFLRVPDIDLLRAHVLFLTSLLHNSDSSSLWIMMGSAIRMAQTQGLHRDSARFGLSPFEIEMRRRLWWYIVTLDARLTEIVGSESCLPNSMDTLLPSNFDDGDLAPDMTKPPHERRGASEMTFCLLNYEIASFQQENDPRICGFEPRLSNRSGMPGEKRDVSDLENFVEEKFLRFCDPVIPLQFLTTTMARSIICKLRLRARHRKPRLNLDEVPNMSSEQSIRESNKILNLSVRNIEYDNLMHSSRSLRGFFWLINFCFPWGAPIFLLKNLASRSEWGDEKEAAWAQIEELYEHHPEFIETDKVMHLIVGGLTLKAWASRQAVLESRGMFKQRTPAMVAALQTRHDAFLSRHNDSRTGMVRVAGEETNIPDMSSFDTVNTANFDLVDSTFEGVDWSNWMDC